MQLIGGETAEMPGMYGADDYDLAGFAVGVAENLKSLTVQKWQKVMFFSTCFQVGIHQMVTHFRASCFCGIHRVRKSCQNWKARKLKEVLLEPTRIYVKAVLLPSRKSWSTVAYITGGGFIENVPRMFAADLAAEIEEDKGSSPSYFQSS